MASKPRSKFVIGEEVTIRKWHSHGTETGVIASVTPSFHQFNDDTFTTYRYGVKMDNGRGAFGASVRFVGESELRKSLVKPTKKAEAA